MRHRGLKLVTVGVVLMTIDDLYLLNETSGLVYCFHMAVSVSNSLNGSNVSANDARDKQFKFELTSDPRGLYDPYPIAFIYTCI